jgi:hypothetical protein
VAAVTLFAALLLRRRGRRRGHSPGAGTLAGPLPAVTTDVGEALGDASAPSQRLSRLLTVIEAVILPLTARGVARGNRIFGAALLRASDLSLVVASTNQSSLCPVFHAETRVLLDFFELPKETRPDIGECLLLSSHESCSM